VTRLDVIAGNKAILLQTEAEVLYVTWVTEAEVEHVENIEETANVILR
jgi:hypothetical protein